MFYVPCGQKGGGLNETDEKILKKSIFFEKGLDKCTH